tara:strand:- start:1431 stop:1658 length:228 start_codon:yes stop_codon:yes gene_type:complete
MKYTVSTIIILLSLILIGPSAVSVDTKPIEDEKHSQPEIFSDKSKKNCIDNIQIQQRTMVKELKKIKSLLKKKKK